MDELIKLVSQKVGISEEQAKMAIDEVLDFLKEKLPDPIGSQLENLLEGGSDPLEMLKGLGGLFGM